MNSELTSQLSPADGHESLKEKLDDVLVFADPVEPDGQQPVAVLSVAVGSCKAGRK